MTKKKVAKSVKRVVESAVNYASLIMTAFNTIPQRFNAKRNPANDRMLISNIPTQILADRPHSFKVVYVLPTGQEKTVKREAYMPAHDDGGDEHRAQAGKFFTAYRQGNFKTKASAEREFYSLLSYFIVCISKGKLPNPDKRSGASTIRSRFVDYWLKESGVSLKSIQVLGSGGRQITYQPNQFEAINSLFRYNADDILTNWDNSVRAGKASDFTI